MSIDISNIQNDAKRIVEQVAHVYTNHTQDDFIGLIVHGSAVKGGIIPGSSDIDFSLYLKESAFADNGRLPLQLYLKIHRDLAKIDTYPFSYIQCEALSTVSPTGYTGPIPGAYVIVAGELPVEEATNDQLKNSASQSLSNLVVVPKYFTTLLDHGNERLARIIRLLSTQVSPTLYHVVSLEQDNAINVWQLPKNEVIKQLPEQEMQRYAFRFYECARSYYPNQTSVNDALEMIELGSNLFNSVKNWYETKVSNG